MSENTSPPLELWEREVLAGHRWGRHGDQAAARELARLRARWARIQSVGETVRPIAEQIAALEICNCDLEESILALCAAIASGQPARRGIGHRRAISARRWQQIWAYDAVLRDWLAADGPPHGYGVLLALCDPNGETRQHVRALLGERTERKALYAERLCLLIEFSLYDHFPPGSAQLQAHTAAAAALEEALQTYAPDPGLVNAMHLAEDHGYACYPGLELCHHKLFRRLDILISSIGAERWRGAMPRRGTDGFDRAALLDRYLAPIERWIDGQAEDGEDELARQIRVALGAGDDTKRFLAAFLVSVLRAQGKSARQRAERACERP
jgi:hypothetical protein